MACSPHGSSNVSMKRCVTHRNVCNFAFAVKEARPMLLRVFSFDNNEEDAAVTDTDLALIWVNILHIRKTVLRITWTFDFFPYAESLIANHRTANKIQ
jgi:hypothetical protein